MFKKGLNKLKWGGKSNEKRNVFIGGEVRTNAMFTHFPSGV